MNEKAKDIWLRAVEISNELAALKRQAQILELRQDIVEQLDIATKEAEKVDILYIEWLCEEA